MPEHVPPPPDLVFRNVQFRIPSGRSLRRGEHLTLSLRLPGQKWRPMHVGRFNAFIPRLDGSFGLKLLKNIYSRVPDSDLVQRIVCIHQDLSAAGIGPKVREAPLHVRFPDCPGFERVRPLLHWDSDTQYDTFAAFWVQTLPCGPFFANRVQRPLNLALRRLGSRPGVATWFRKSGLPRKVCRSPRLFSLYRRLLLKDFETAIKGVVYSAALQHRKGFATILHEVMDNSRFVHGAWQVFDIDKNFRRGFSADALRPETTAAAPSAGLKDIPSGDAKTILTLDIEDGDFLGRALHTARVTAVHRHFPSVDRLMRFRAGREDRLTVLQACGEDPCLKGMIQAVGTPPYDLVVLGPLEGSLHLARKILADLALLRVPNTPIAVPTPDLTLWQTALEREGLKKTSSFRLQPY